MNKINALKPSLTQLDIKRGTSAAVERIRGGRLRAIRDRIALRDGYICQMCGYVTARGEVDHKVPLHLGGQESDENRWWLCSGCHKVKSEREETWKELGEQEKRMKTTFGTL